MIAALDGVDLIVFTGGIGENAVEAQALPSRNRTGENPISDPASRYAVYVLPSREDEQIVPHTRALFPWSLSG